MTYRSRSLRSPAVFVWLVGVGCSAAGGSPSVSGNDGAVTKRGDGSGGVGDVSGPGGASGDPGIGGGSIDAAAVGGAAGGPEDAGARRVTYLGDVQPILRSSCRGCHTAGAEPCPEGISVNCSPTYSPFAESYADTQQPSTKCSGLVVGACLGLAVEDQELVVEKHCRTSTVRIFHREEWRCLTDEERALIAAWVSDGMIEQ